MLTEEQFSYLAKKYMDTVFRLALHCSGARSLANRARSVSNITPA